MNRFDIIIIGGGVAGSAIARELSKYNTKTAVIEKESDVVLGTSGRNSGVVHSGFNQKTGTLKAKFNVEGQKMFSQLCKELDVPYKVIGTITVAQDEDELLQLKKLKKQGEDNGLDNLKLIDEKELKRLEPNVRGKYAMVSPSGGITCPFTLTIALAENAIANGVKYFLETEVTAINKKGNCYIVKTTKGDFISDIVVNSAGLYSDKIAGFVGINKYKIFPTRGEYFITDIIKDFTNSMVYPIPPKKSKGVHLTQTIAGNLLIGPSAEYITDKEDVASTKKAMDELLVGIKLLFPTLSQNLFIRNYSGIRAKVVDKNSKEDGDFIISEDLPGFINLVGIESPGLTASPAIAKYVLEMIRKKIRLEPNKSFNPLRKGMTKFRELSNEQRQELIKKNPNYGEIVCRCKYVTKQEIIEALNNPLGVKTLSGIKYRAMAMMGRCQSGFCEPKIVKIMEQKISLDKITLFGRNSNLFVGKVK